MLLHDIAARVETASDEHESGDKRAVWLENCRKALGDMEADERFRRPVSKRVGKNKG